MYEDKCKIDNLLLLADIIQEQLSVGLSLYQYPPQYCDLAIDEESETLANFYNLRELHPKQIKPAYPSLTTQLHTKTKKENH
jgi:hypothetical protein